MERIIFNNMPKDSFFSGHPDQHSPGLSDYDFLSVEQPDDEDYHNMEITHGESGEEERSPSRIKTGEIHNLKKMFKKESTSPGGFGAPEGDAPLNDFERVQKATLMHFMSDAMNRSGDDLIARHGLFNLGGISNELSLEERERIKKQDRKKRNIGITAQMRAVSGVPFHNTLEPSDYSFYYKIVNGIIDQSVPTAEAKIKTLSEKMNNPEYAQIQKAHYYLLALCDSLEDFKTIYEKYKSFDLLSVPETIALVEDVMEKTSRRFADKEKNINIAGKNFYWREALKNLLRVGPETYKRYSALIATLGKRELIKEKTALLANRGAYEAALGSSDANPKSLDDYYQKNGKVDQNRKEIKDQKERLSVVKAEQLNALAIGRKGEGEIPLAEIIEKSLTRVLDKSEEEFDIVVRQMRILARKHSYIVPILYRILARGQNFFQEVYERIQENPGDALQLEEDLEGKYHDNIDDLLKNYLREPRSKKKIVNKKVYKEQERFALENERYYKVWSRFVKEGILKGQTFYLKAKDGAHEEAFRVKDFLCDFWPADGRALTPEEEKEHYIAILESEKEIGKNLRNEKEKFFIKVRLKDF